MLYSKGVCDASVINLELNRGVSVGHSAGALNGNLDKGQVSGLGVSREGSDCL